MTPSLISTLIYGILVLLGGILGYAKAKSLPSLISGIVSGALLLFSALMQFQGIAFGKILAIITSSFLIIVFLARLIKTKKFMPAGLLVAVGIICLILMIR
jgi:uncharacterized membrane protein (UPF0136 family)